MRKLVISGRFRKGLGKGRYFLRQKGYKDQFVMKLGINPYHGTLNVNVSGASARKLAAVRRNKGILVRGFIKDGRSFGEVMCYKAEMCGVRCALVVPKRSKHKNVAEIISSKKLTKALGIRQGDLVSVTLWA